MRRTRKHALKSVVLGIAFLAHARAAHGDLRRRVNREVARHRRRTDAVFGQGRR